MAERKLIEVDEENVLLLSTILPTRGNNPWVDGISYAGKLVNNGTDIDSSLSGGAAVEVNVAFPDQLSLPITAEYLAAFDQSAGVLPWTANLVAAYEEAFDNWAKVANIKFLKVEDPTRADIQYYSTSYPTSSGGTVFLGRHQDILQPPARYLPQLSTTNGAFFGKNTYTDPGGAFLQMAIHEVGHGIGLKHPHDHGSGAAITIFPGLVAYDSLGNPGKGLYGLNQNPYTIMSYNRGLFADVADNYLAAPTELAGHAATPMALDIMVAQIKYGYNPTTASGDDIYLLPTSGPRESTLWQAIYDTGGDDWISADAASSGVVINLQAARMNAYKFQEGEYGESYGFSSSKYSDIFARLVNYLAPQGALLGSAQFFAATVEAVVAYYEKLKGPGAFRNFWNKTVEENGRDEIHAASIVVVVLDEYSRGLMKSDASFARTAVKASVDAELVLAESAKHVGGYISQQLQTQGGFTIAAGTTIENARGGSYDDVLVGNSANNILYGMDGNDLIDGLAGDDDIYGGGGNDTLYGGDGNDSITDDHGSNSLDGGLGDDILISTISQASSLERDGQANAAISDLLSGGDGNDTIYVTGDTYVSNGPVDVKAFGGNGNDIISVIDSQAGIANINGNDHGFASVTVDAGAGSDRITVAGALTAVITTGGDSDTIILSAQQYRTLVEGARAFQYSDGSSTVVNPEPITVNDFTPGVGGDLLDCVDLLRDAAISYDGINPFASGYLLLDQSGNDTLLRFDADGMAGTKQPPLTLAILKNLKKSSLVPANFSPGVVDISSSSMPAATSYEAVAKITLPGVYRFLNRGRGTHFYTDSLEEVNYIKQNNPDYEIEGKAYDAVAGSGGKQLYRFANSAAGYHFMTASDEEYYSILQHPDWGYTYEGRAFAVSTESTKDCATAVFRFSRTFEGHGQHFYTASEAEKKSVIDNKSLGYKYEGIAWYARSDNTPEGTSGNVDRITTPGVYRFVNRGKGTYFYTSSLDEVNNLKLNNPDFQLEGKAYDPITGSGGKQLYRFVNAAAGYHFMTASESEYNSVLQHPDWGYTYEGRAFAVSTERTDDATTAVFRFSRTFEGHGQHFYTASDAEKQDIFANPGWGYKYEGIAWYAK